MLDDLGAEKTSEWVEETMNLIVNTRYNERRLTIFTSNYPDIPDDTDPNSLLFRIGHRMRSRLHEMCEFVEMDGADYREMPTRTAASTICITLWKMRQEGAAVARADRPPGARAAARRQGRPQVVRRPGGILGDYPITQPRNYPMLGLYVHIPFCSAICNYCNFNRGLFDAALKARYVEALVRGD